MAGPGPGPGDPDEQYDFLFKLVLVGDASVGKTCVVQRFKTGAFSERQGSTIGVDFTMKTLEIQGKRVKVGGPAWGRRAGVAWPSLPAAQPGLRRVPRLTGAPRRRSFSGGGCRPQRAPRIVLRFLANPFRLPVSLPSVGAGLGLGVWVRFSPQSAGLGLCACVRVCLGGSVGEQALPSGAHTLGALLLQNKFARGRQKRASECGGQKAAWLARLFPTSIETPSSARGGGNPARKLHPPPPPLND